MITVCKSSEGLLTSWIEGFSPNLHLARGQKDENADQSEIINQFLAWWLLNAKYNNSGNAELDCTTPSPCDEQDVPVT